MYILFYNPYRYCWAHSQKKGHYQSGRSKINFALQEQQNKFCVWANGVQNKFCVWANGVQNLFCVWANGVQNLFCVWANGVQNLFCVGANGVANLFGNAPITKKQNKL
ncbi:MAG: hypothetical protein DRR16_25475 [Candidatus Parabeggiatoa sp. nov. 3]|nr:MAG: hypothetical protein DRR00_20490 [Gammaproteobacteria bacterium]RKZ62434.1 MAG: hypothetical protein DRQ99_18745 [Gammaproteobacteria bacterium]RKZ79571.1 MAG: hypothetical protein DRR16_25475 [Gammaproteobacteria bacterium]